MLKDHIKESLAMVEFQQRQFVCHAFGLQPVNRSGKFRWAC